MGKVEDMRRQRELLFAQNERAAAARAAAAKAPTGAAPAPLPAPPAALPASPAATSDDDLGEASEPTPAAAPGRGGRRAGPAAAGKAARSPRGARGGDEQGACSVCGKQRPLQGGLVSSHQKGFGKMCAGSRKPPAGA
jgi:hypothetical protein